MIVYSSLILENTTLKFNCAYDGQYGIDVRDDAYLEISDFNSHPSNITAINQYHYTFKVQNGASAILKNSEIHKCGYASESINSNSGVCIESNDIEISGCTFSDNYVGLLFSYTNLINMTPSRFNNLTYINLISDNVYGIYLFDSTDIVVEGTMMHNNNEFDLYVSENSNVKMVNSYAGKTGGAGNVITGNTVDVYDGNDWFEIEYNSTGKTLQYQGWLDSANNHYANSYCVLRRGLDYILKINALTSLISYKNDAPEDYWFEYKNACTGWGFDIQYPTAPIDSTFLPTYKSGDHILSIPSDYPIVYGHLQMNFIYGKSGTNEIQGIDIYIILDYPQTSGSDFQTGLTSEARSEYMYIGDSGTAPNIPTNIDLAGPFWWGSGSSPTSYYYGGGSTTSGLNYAQKSIYKIACAAAYNSVLGFDAADKVKSFVNYLVYGVWNLQNNSAYTRAVNSSLAYVTTAMASNPSTNIVHDVPSGNPHATDHDALGLHGGCGSEDGNYSPNNWDYQCHDFAAISTALDRAIGLPARPVTGWNYNESGAKLNINYHVWTEVWIPDGQDINGTDNQWCVFDACGCKEHNAVITDDDSLVYNSNNRTNYYDGLTNDFKHPWEIYCYFKTNNTQTVQYSLKDYYKIS